MLSEVGQWRWEVVVFESWRNWRWKHIYVNICLLWKKVWKGTDFFFPGQFQRMFFQRGSYCDKSFYQIKFAVTFTICWLSFMYSWSVKLACAMIQAELLQQWNLMQVDGWRGLGIWLLFGMLSAWHFDFTKFNLLWAEDICFCPDCSLASRVGMNMGKLK